MKVSWINLFIILVLPTDWSPINTNLYFDTYFVILSVINYIVYIYLNFLKLFNIKNYIINNNFINLKINDIFFIEYIINNFF